jgi:hypothetical protein
VKKILLFLSFITLAMFYSSCDKQSGTGTIVLSITDSPIDSSTVSGVYITVSEIQVHTGDSGWVTMDGFAGPKKFDLLDITRGKSELLGSVNLEGGNYTRIRFMLDAISSAL